MLPRLLFSGIASGENERAESAAGGAVVIELTRRHAILTVVLSAMMSLGVYLTSIRTALTGPPTGAPQIALPPCFLIYLVAERGTFIFWESWILLAFWVFVINLATAVIIFRLLDMVRASEQRRR